MRVHVVSDVHGAAADLARAADGSDVFVCLGDLVLFLDYHDARRGIIAELLGADHAAAYIAARTANRFDQARELARAAWARIGVHDPEHRWEILRDRIGAQYDELFAAMPAPALLTYGNVDVPDLWATRLRSGHRVVEAGVVEMGGQRWGFVGGGLVSPMRTPFEVSEERYDAAVRALGAVDVLFTHIPPAVPELTYDVEARRFERGSTALSEFIRDVQPRFHLFGHVHQPLAARRRIGRTECVNVGHFQARRTPFVIDL